MKANLIELVQSELASNMVLVRKSDGCLQFCVDYTQLSERTFKKSYLLLWIVCLDASAGASWFSMFDIKSGYRQVPMVPKDSDKTFLIRRGTFWFKLMPFGLYNAPATFQRLINMALSGLDPEGCLVYLDDITVHSRNLDSHPDRL